MVLDLSHSWHLGDGLETQGSSFMPAKKALQDEVFRWLTKAFAAKRRKITIFRDPA